MGNKQQQIFFVLHQINFVFNFIVFQTLNYIKKKWKINKKYTKLNILNREREKREREKK